MSYTVENVNGCTKKISFKFEEFDLSGEIEAALKEKRKASNLKGFRKGKAPIDMIKKLYGPQVENDALNRFVQKEFYQAINEEKLTPVGYPSFENLNYEKGESINFDAIVEIFPNVEIKDFSSIEVKKDNVEVTDEEVETSKKSHVQQKAEIKEIDDESRELQNGLFAIMNFEGELQDGSRPDNMKGSDFQLEIGSGQFIPGFEEQMVGMKKGEKKTIEVTFPEDYHAEDLKGALVKFHIELNEIKEKILPEFNDELAKELGHESVEEFEKKTKEMLLSQKERQANEKLHQEILEKLIEIHPFDIPSTMIKQQEEYLKKDLLQTLKYQGFTDTMADEYFSKWADDLTQKATFQVRSGLLLDTLGKDYGVEATDEDLDNKIDETAAMTNSNADEIRKYYKSNENIKKNMLYAIKEEKTFEKIKEKITVI
ncbi:MAG: trigger factor [Halobacteriovoraceae bacterium]|nr:trigger factor [Halobacteriovoraceae bacterium]